MSGLVNVLVETVVEMDEKSLAAHFPHMVRAGPRSLTNMERLDAIDDSRAWCEANLGPTARIAIMMDQYMDTTAAWLSTGARFYFKDPNHAVWFRLVCG